MFATFSLKGLLSCLLFAGATTAAAITQDLEARQSTCNTASNRRCWTSNFDITTDYETATPAGGSVTYNLEITEVHNWKGPDGVVKSFVQLINGQFPGPTLYAKWGDTITVNVKNSMPTNGYVTLTHFQSCIVLTSDIAHQSTGMVFASLGPMSMTA